MRTASDSSALKQLIRQIDFTSERFFNLYFDSSPELPPANVTGEVWTNLSSLTADLGKLRGEFARLRRGVEDLRLPAIEAVGLDRVLEQLRSLDTRLRPLTAKPATGEDESRLKRLLKDFLPVVDTIDRIFELMDKQPDTVSSSLRVGLESLNQLISETLGRHGLRVIELKLADQFDPHTQMAMSTEESTTLPDGTVSQVLTKGYLLGDQVLRSAQVVVVRNNK